MWAPTGDGGMMKEGINHAHARKGKMWIKVDINVDRRPVKQQRTKPRDQTKAGNATAVCEIIERFPLTEAPKVCLLFDGIGARHLSRVPLGIWAW